MTHIEKILQNSDRYRDDIETLGEYIKLLEKNLEKERAEVRKLREKVVNFDRLRDNFRRYRIENPRRTGG